MGGDVVQAERLGPVDQQAEQAMSLGKVPDALGLLLGDPVRDEAGQTPAGAVPDHTQRGVPGLRQPRSDLHDPGQQIVEAQIGRHADHGLEQQLPALLLLQGAMDPLDQLP